MEQQILSVEQLLENPNLFSGFHVIVEGLYLASYYDSVLIPLSEDTETANINHIIKIDHSGLVDRCFAALSPWVGGQYYYRDKAIISGTFLYQHNPVITSVLEMQIIRDDRAIKINLD